MMSERRAIDWEAVEREYRAGILSIREIARTHGCTHKAITGKAARLGWVRDLTEKVRQEASARLAAESVPTSVPTPNAREIIDSAASVQVEVVRGHRRDLSLLAEDAQVLRQKFRARLDAIADDGDLVGASAVLESLSRTVARLIPLERQAFSIDANPADAGKQSEITVKLDGLSDDPHTEREQLRSRIARITGAADTTL